MTIILAVVLALAFLMTLLFIPITVDIRPLSGPDAMGLAGVFFLALARALCILLVLSLVAARGGFAWIHPGRGVQAVVMLCALGCVVAMEIWAIDAATGWYGRAARGWVASFSLIAPTILILLAAAGLDRGRNLAVGTPAYRGAGAVVILLLVAGCADLARRNRVVARERRAHVAAMEAEQQRARDEKRAALHALDRNSPLQAWIAFTNDSDDDVREAAVDSIRTRPRLREELAAVLRGPDPLPALRWLWLWSHDRPAELAPALHDAAMRLPDWARDRYDDSERVNDGDVSTACEALVVLAEEFEVHGVDYREPIEKLAAFLNSRALPEDQLGSDPTYQARAMVQYWFNRHPSAEGSADGVE